jgi:hypothetical protein
MNTVLRAATRGLSAAVLHVLVGCAAPDAGGADGGSPPRPVDAGPFDARDASASTDVATREVGVTDSACASIAATASVIRRPLDVIVVVDSSPSFDRPRAAIGATLAPNLVRALEAASVDYRVVVVGGSIATPASPRYVALSESIGSTGLLPSLPRYLRRALPNLRLDSLKAIVDFTDDGWIATGSVLGTREEFYAGMAAPDLTDAFGTRMNRRYTVHAVAGLRPNAPSSAPWPPAAPIVMDRCDGFASNPAVELQSLAIETGGFRFPLCNFMEYSGLFDAVAALAIENVRVPCEFGVPMTSDGRTPDIGYARMNVTIEDRTTTTTPVANEAACGEGFHLVRGSMGDGGAPGMSDRVRLCPATCARLRAEPTAVVRFTFECPPG